MKISDLFITAISSGGFLVFLTWFFRNGIFEWFKKGIEHDFEKKLETHKANLKSDHDHSLEMFRARLDQDRAIQAVATASFNAGHSAAHERRLKAIDKLWQAFILVKKETGGVLTIVDILTDSEFLEIPHDSRINFITKDLSDDEIVKMTVKLNEGIELVRPFVGESLWALFYAYRALRMRLIYLIFIGVKENKMKDWKNDNGILQLLKYVLTDKEMETFKSKSFGAMSFFSETIESRIIEFSQKIISGETSAQVGLDQAKKIMAAASNLNRKIKT
jgi:hypothetical protein